MSKPYRSVEQALRDALVSLRNLIAAELHDGKNGSCPICLAVRAADEAIALRTSETLCQFAGDSGRPCQTCGKSWHSPDHQAPIFDPKVAR